MKLDDINDVSIATLDISDRLRCVLFDCGWLFVGELCDRDHEELLATNRVHRSGVAELQRALRDAGAIGRYLDWPAYRITEPWRPDPKAWIQTPNRYAASPHYWSGYASLWPRETPTLREARGWVYFIRSGPYIKIGVARNLLRRFAGLQSANAMPLRFWFGLQFGSYRAALDMERVLHARFATFKHQGEWFHLRAPIVRFVRDARHDELRRIAALILETVDGAAA